MLFMGRYVKKAMVIDAVQWLRDGDHDAVITDPENPGFGFIDTLEGRLRVSPGDWIITGVAGESYPCKAEIFEQLYEPADE